MLKSLTAIVVLLAVPHVAEARCKVAKIETDINAVRLGDAASVERALGKLETLPIGASSKDPSERDSPELVLFNRDKTEQAVLTKHPGDMPGSFLQIDVRQKVDPNLVGKMLVGKALDVEHLSTERGIHLGVSEQFVTQLLGSCFRRSVSKTGDTTLEYDLADVTHPYLKRVNMPSYFGRYGFRDGKLFQFEIGSEYP